MSQVTFGSVVVVFYHGGDYDQTYLFMWCSYEMLFNSKVVWFSWVVSRFHEFKDQNPTGTRIAQTTIIDHLTVHLTDHLFSLTRPPQPIRPDMVRQFP